MLPICKKIRKDILSISKESGIGHIPSSFSVVEILHAIYTVMNHKPHNPSWSGRDIFILSKGHAALCHYCVLADQGYFNIEEVYSHSSFMSNFGGHPDRTKVPGVEVSTGSLGHGIGVAVGIALALRIKKSNRKVFVVIGDGEANEGTVWEAALVASHLRLSNLTIIYDDNKSHSRGLQIHNAAEKFRAFGCEVSEVDGHNVIELKCRLLKESTTVHAIIADTVKGYGCQTLVNNPYEWPTKSPNDLEFETLMRELDETAV